MLKDANEDLRRSHRENNEFKPDVSCWVLGSLIEELLTHSAANSPATSSVCLRGSPAVGSKQAVTIYIVGTLDLRDALSMDGSALAPFIATHCQFVRELTGDQAPDSFANLPLANIEIARAHLSRISLRGSVFARLRANNCIIDGDCDLTTDFDEKLREATPCQVRLDGAAIGGSLHLSGRTFTELDAAAYHQEKSSLTPPYYRNCALDLCNAMIGRDIAVIGSTFTGLLNARGVTVHGSIRMMAIHVRRPDGDDSHRSGKAIDLQYARVDGNISCRGSRNPDNVNEIDGTIFLNAARVGGEVIIKEGRFYGGDATDLTEAGEARATAIDIQYANVAGNLHIGAEYEHEQLSYVRGAIRLNYAVVQGNLAIRKIAEQDSGDRQICRVQAHGITINQHLDIRESTFRADPRRPGIQYSAIDFWRSTILLGVKIDRKTRIDGSVRFNNSVLSRDVILRGTFIGGCGPVAADDEKHVIQTRLDLSNSMIDGDLRINAGSPSTAPTQVTGQPPTARHNDLEIDGAVTLDRSMVTGRTVLENIRFRYPIIDENSGPARRLSADERDSREQSLLGQNSRTILNLNTFKAQGGLVVRNLQWHERGYIPKGADGRLARFLKPMGGVSIARDAALREDLATIDARGLHCAFLNDGHGEEWNLTFGHRLRLDQIVIDRIEEDEGHHRDSANRATMRRPANPLGSNDKALTRLMFLAHQATRISIVSLWNKTFFIWWRTRYFAPQPYDSFARAYIRRGNLLIGRKILIRKTDIESWRKSRDIVLGPGSGRLKLFREPGPTFLGFLRRVLTLAIMPIVMVAAAAVQTVLLAYRWMFGYGLEWQRAIVSLLFWLLVGVFGAHYARTGEPFAYSPPPVVNGQLNVHIALVKTMDERPTVDVKGHGIQVSISQQDQPCDIDSVSFAVDAFIPLLDMNMTPQCQIRDDPPPPKGPLYAWWRIVLLCYELIGWIVVSLTILTISGIIRRDVDK